MDLGIGAGIFELDHHTVGDQPWSVKERVRRFEQYVEILDGVLRSDGEPYEFDGEYLRTRVAATTPGPGDPPAVPVVRPVRPGPPDGPAASFQAAAAAGIQDFVLTWPASERIEEFERLAPTHAGLTSG